MPRSIARYGWRPDLPDHRDRDFVASPRQMANLPPRTDLRGLCPPVYDQGQLGSCTAHALAAAVEFDRKKQGLAASPPSRLFLYYNERALEGTANYDSGAQLRDGIKSLATQGDCPEPLWPYDVTQFAQQPPSLCYQNARQHRALQYQRLPSILSQLKACLAAGYPFVFGFTAYPGLESDRVAQTGILNLPANGDSPVGGHAVMAVGYDDATQRFLVRNSWGPDWGQQGYFTMPYGYLTNPNLAADFWTLREVS